MKLRLIVAVCLLAASLGTAIGFVAFLNRSANTLEAALTEALEAALTESADWEAKTLEVVRLWERDSALIHVMLPHINLNELEWALGTLPEYQKERETTLYIEQCVRGIQCVRTIREMENPSWGNVF